MSVHFIIEKASKARKDKDFDSARRLYRQLLSTNPSNQDFYLELSKLEHEANNSKEAFRLIQSSLKLNPEHLESYLFLIDLLRDIKEKDQAKSICQIALKRFNKGDAFLQCIVHVLKHFEQGGDFEEAKKILCDYETILDASFSFLEHKILTEFSVYPVRSSTQEMHRFREYFFQKSDEMLRRYLPVSGCPQNYFNYIFYCGYEEDPPRPVLERANLLYQTIFPELVWKSPYLAPYKRGNKIRIGFVTPYLDKFHAISFCFSPIVKYLDRTRYEIFYFRLPNALKAIDYPESKGIDDILGKVHLIEISHNIQDSRQIIATYRLDILVFVDSPMVSQEYFLAFSRLAPAQVAFFGHPTTTGLPMIDVIVSHKGIERLGAQEDYTESLYLMQDSTVVYEMLASFDESPMPRSTLCLPEDSKLYLCGQTPFKIVPAFDEIFKQILDLDEKARIIFCHGEGEFAQTLQKRLRENLGGSFERCIFLSTLSQKNYFSLLKMVDCILDTFPFGGGNTTVQAISCNVPLVTKEVPRVAGRTTLYVYNVMGMSDCIMHSNDDYVRQAIRIANDTTYRQSLVDRISNNKHKVIRTKEQVIPGYDKLFEKLVERSPLKGF